MTDTITSSPEAAFGGTWALRAVALTKQFPSAGTVLSSVALTAKPGTLTVVAGPRNAGRTTLLRCLAGTYRPTGGQITIGDGPQAIDLCTASPREIAWVRSHSLAVFDGGPAMPPRTNAVTAVSRLGAVSVETARQALGRADLDRVADRAIGQLRPEEARRVGLTAALVKAAPVVLLDEPGRALGTDCIVEWLAERRQNGDTIIVAGSGNGDWDADVVGWLENGVITWAKP